MTLYELSQELRALNRSQQFNQTLNYFKNSKHQFDNAMLGNNRYVVYEMIVALINTGYCDAVFNFMSIYNVSLDGKTFSYLLKVAKDKASINWPFIAKFCCLMNPLSLDTSCTITETIIKGKKKSVEYASDRENWYSLYTKALLETGQYEQCSFISKEALDILDKFHYNNDIWFARRIALSNKNLGDVSTALGELKKLLNKKKEWFIQSEIAQLHFDKGELEPALEYAIQGLLNYGGINFKVGLLNLVGDILMGKQNKEMAYYHYLLSVQLRIKNEWKVPLELQEKVKRTVVGDGALTDIDEIHKKLQSYWNSAFGKIAKGTDSNSFISGVIDKILNDNEKGINGFIKFGKNQSVYFRVPIQKNGNSLIKGQEVTFKILPAKEPGQRDLAINVRPKK